MLLLALALILAGGAVGVSKADDLETTISAIGCSVAVTLDDIINGNETEGKYFIGIKTFALKVSDITGSLVAIENQF